MTDVQQFLRESKVLYKPFMKFVATCTLKDLLLTFQSPFLVGQDLYQGELMEKTVRGYNPTVKFQGNENAAAEQTNTLNKHIFYFHSTDDSGKDIRFNVGRTSNNDVVIVDYTISKQHAVVIRRQNRFLIVDQGATNGTTLNMQKLEPNTEHLLKGNDLVAFGRLGFVIMKPIKLFLISRQHSNLNHTIQTEFMNILKYVKSLRLQKIALDIGLETREETKRELVERLLRKLDSEQILERLF